MKEGFSKENLTDALWRYALARYGQPEVAELCLALQTQFGQDVNMLLAAGFSDLKGIVWSAATVARLRKACAELRQSYILPMRAMRVAAKAQAPHRAYQALKDAELALEQWQLSILAEKLSEEYASLLKADVSNDMKQHNSNILLCAISAEAAERDQLLALVAALNL